MSGATIDDLYTPQSSDDSPPWDDPNRSHWGGWPDIGGPYGWPALSRLDAEDTAVVTIGIGGNDVGFGGTMSTCVSKSWKDSIDLSFFGWHNYTCEGEFGETVSDAIDGLENRAQRRRDRQASRAHSGGPQAGSEGASLRRRLSAFLQRRDRWTLPDHQGHRSSLAQQHGRGPRRDPLPRRLRRRRAIHQYLRRWRGSRVLRGKQRRLVYEARGVGSGRDPRLRVRESPWSLPPEQVRLSTDRATPSRNRSSIP